MIHSHKWNAELIEDFLWQQGTQRLQGLWEQGERALVIWDERSSEKPSGLQAERFCLVRSTKAVQLKRIKPGFSIRLVDDRSLCQVSAG